MKSVILCADDFAYSPAISQSILALAEQRRLSATSCMTNMPTWPTAAKQLKLLDGQLDIGLHFNLSEGTALSPNGQPLFMSLQKLLIRSVLGTLDKQLVYAELCAQIEQFCENFGRLPDFIDGHQHIHQLPVIRAALLEAYHHYFPTKKASIRIASNSLGKSLQQSSRCPKLLVITLTGALILKKQLTELAIPHNQSFSGIYDLKPQTNYAELFAVFLQEVGERGLIMCHPANKSITPKDCIAAARQQEFDFFSSDLFATVLGQVKLARF